MNRMLNDSQSQTTLKQTIEFCKNVILKKKNFSEIEKIRKNKLAEEKTCVRVFLLVLTAYNKITIYHLN